MNEYAYVDVEADGLLDTATRIHCIAIQTSESKGPVLYGPDALTPALQVLSSCRKLIGHNLIAFDLPILHKVLNFKFRGEVCDTLLMSQLLLPDRPGGHSLEAWGGRLGVRKTDYLGWCAENGVNNPYAQYSQAMGEYCQQDVRALVAIHRHLSKGAKSPDVSWGRSLRLETTFAKDFASQAARGVAVDVPLARSLVSEITREMEGIARQVEPGLPLRPGTMGQLRAATPPKKLFLKDGKPTKGTYAWFEEVRNSGSGWEGFKFGQWHPLPTPVGEDGARLPLATEFPMLLKDQEALKDWLMAEGWVPSAWNYKKAPDRHGKMRIARGDDGQPLRSQPKLHDKGTLCPNLEAIAGKFGAVGQVVRWMVLRHRRGLIQGVLDNTRPDGRVSATGRSLGTPTGRVTHAIVANVPKAEPDVVLGKECRSLFIAPPGRVMVGVDASGLELRCLAHYAGSDGLVDIVVNGTKEQGTEIHSVLLRACHPLVTSRSIQKNVTYAFLYGASDEKLGATAGHLGREAARAGVLIRERMVKALPGLTELMRKVEAAAARGYVIAIDGRKIPIRSKHSTLNTLLQSCGSICVKYAQNYMNQEIRRQGLRARQVISYHDEVQLEASPEDAQLAGRLFVDGLREAAKYFELKCPLDGEVKIGKNWAETH